MFMSTKAVRVLGGFLLMIVPLIGLTPRPAAPAQAESTPPGVYLWLDWPLAQSYNFDADLTVVDDAPNIIYAHQFGFEHGGGGYIGLEFSGNQRKVRFAIYDAIGATEGCTSFTADGSGWQCLKDYEWQPGHTYRLRVWAHHMVDAGEYWLGAIYDYATGQDTILGSILLPPGHGWLASSSVIWTQYLGYDSCDTPYTRALWSNPFARHAERDGGPAKTTASYGSSSCTLSDVDSIGNAQYILEAGEGVDRDTPGDSVMYISTPDDRDGDGLTNEWEERLRINPDSEDTDGDGLLDPWEIRHYCGTEFIPGAGFDLDNDGEIDAFRDDVFGPYSEWRSQSYPPGSCVPQPVSLRLGALPDRAGRFLEPFPYFVKPPDPRHKDIYLEIDWQDCDKGGCPEFASFRIDPTHHAPNFFAMQDVVDAFDEAPVTNPDGRPGINLHILIDEALPHKPVCDRAASKVRREYFGTWHQRHGSRGGSNANDLRAKAHVFRYVWSGHSTYDDADPALCPMPSGRDIIRQGVGTMPLPEYDYSPFGDANVGGRDILASLGPLWVCPSYNVIYGKTACFRKWPALLSPGIFPAMLYINGNHNNGVIFPNPMNRMLGLHEDDGIQQLWSRSLMHLLGHALGLADDHDVRNDPQEPASDRDGDGVNDRRSPQSYADWNNLRYAPLPFNGRSPTHQEGNPYWGKADGISGHASQRPALAQADYDPDNDGIGEFIDNCPGIPNPGSPQPDLDADASGDACDPDIDGDDREGADDLLPSDTDNDGTENVADSDDDADEVLDASDNCSLAANANQIDTEGDGSGNVCDGDDDNDGLPDLVEQAQGSNALSSASTPEFVGGDTSCNDGSDNDQDGRQDSADTGCIDTDSDTIPDALDNCPQLANYGWEDRDVDGMGDSCDPTPLPPNGPPTAAAGGPYQVGEGSVVAIMATATDAEAGRLTFAWDLNDDGTFGEPGPGATLSAVGLDGPSSLSIGVQVADQWGATDTDTTTISVVNVAPSVGPISGPAEPVQVTSVMTTSATFTDPGLHDTHIAIWSWGDGSTSPGNIQGTPGAGTVSGSHAYAIAGTYTITLTITDDDASSNQTIFPNVIVTSDATPSATITTAPIQPTLTAIPSTTTATPPRSQLRLFLPVIRR